MKKVQKVYLIHDYFYASLNFIPSNSLDGKDYPKEVYIQIDEEIIELSTDNVIFYETYEEAIREL